MLGLVLALLLASCSLSTGFLIPSTRPHGFAITTRMAFSDESPSDIKKPMTTAEKERDFQKTLDNLLAEARANNAQSGAENGEFSIEEMAVAAEEMKKLKALNSGITADAIVTTDFERKKMSYETEPVNEGGGIGKKLAIFGALTIVFAAALLPIIDKIFPDPPSIETSIISK